MSCLTLSPFESKPKNRIFLGIVEYSQKEPSDLEASEFDTIFCLEVTSLSTPDIPCKNQAMNLERPQRSFCLEENDHT